MVTLDLQSVRSRFPALERTQDGRPVVYLDGPGGSQVPDSVAAAVSGYLTESNANSGGLFASARETDAVIDRARVMASHMTGTTPEEIAFGASSTSLNFMLAHAVARTMAEGDEIVVTQLDHDANVAPWLRVAEDHGLAVRVAPIRPEDGTLDLDALEELIGERTRVVAFTLASNALGTVTDAVRISAAAHRVNALAWADGVHLAPHRRLDRDALEADVLLHSPYKVFGPHLGVAAIRRDLAETLPADRVRPAAQWPPGHRFETGTLSHEGLAGFVASVEYLASLGDGASVSHQLDQAFLLIEEHEAALTRRTLDGLAGMEGCRLYGIADAARVAERTPTFCLTIDGRTSHEVAEALAAQGIFVWHGNYYAPGVMEALGLEDGGAVRAGFLHYSTPEEVDRLLDALEALTP